MLTWYMKNGIMQQLYIYANKLILIENVFLAEKNPTYLSH